MRVIILKNFAKENFPSTPLIDYAVQVEQITTSKVHLVIMLAWLDSPVGMIGTCQGLGGLHWLDGPLDCPIDKIDTCQWLRGLHWTPVAQPFQDRLCVTVAPKRPECSTVCWNSVT